MKVFRRRKIGKKCPLFDFLDKLKCILYNQYKIEHNINVKIEELKFEVIESQLNFHHASTCKQSYLLSEEKNELLKLIEQVSSNINNTESEEELVVIEKWLTSIRPTLMALCRELKLVPTPTQMERPHNKKILSQRRFLSTRKRTNKNTRPSAKAYCC